MPVRVAKENVRQNRELLKQAKGFYKVGLRAKIDVTKAEANLANAEAELIRAKNLAEVAQVTLMTAMGLKTWPYREVEDTLEVAPRLLSLEELKSQALRQRPEIRRNRYQQESDKANLRVARAGYYPSFNTFAAYGWEGSRNTLDDEWWVGAGVTFPLFEGLSTYHSVRQAKAQLKSTLANGESLALQVMKEVEQSYLDVKSAWEVIKARAKAKESAAENLRLAWGRPIWTTCGPCWTTALPRPAWTRPSASRFEQVWNLPTSPARKAPEANKARVAAAGGESPPAWKTARPSGRGGGPRPRKGLNHPQTGTPPGRRGFPG